jgi:RNA polymerase sigma-70 factor, ECF subfamily
MKLEQENQITKGTQTDSAEITVLFERIEKGDSSALTILYDRTSHLLFGLVLRILWDRTAAEEVLLDVYTYVWKHTASYDSKTLQPLDWMIVTARDRALTTLHWHRQHRIKAFVPTGDFDSTMTVSPEKQNLARSSIASLSPAQREILERAFYSGLSYSDIATQIGKPPGAVKIHVRLGMNKLSELFRPLFERQA